MKNEESSSLAWSLSQFVSGTFAIVLLELCSCEDSWTNMLVSVLQHSPKQQALKLVLVHFFSKTKFLNHVWFLWFISEMYLIAGTCDGWESQGFVGSNRGVFMNVCLLHFITSEWRCYEGTKVEKEMAIYIFEQCELSFLMFEKVEIATRSFIACELTMGWPEFKTV